MSNSTKFNADAINRKLEKYDLGGVTFPFSNETLDSMDRIIDTPLRDKSLVESILNLPYERQNDLLTQLETKPNIDFTLAVNPELTEAQYREHMDIANYNYNVEYGSLKDKGKSLVQTSLISNPELSANQLYIIQHTITQNLSTDKLFLPDGKPLSDSEMVNEYTAQIQNKSEVAAKLAEVGIIANNLPPDQQHFLNKLHYEGKTAPEQNALFNSIVSSPEVNKEIFLNTQYEYGGTTLSDEVKNNVFNDYLQNPNAYDKTSSLFNPERRNGIEAGIPANIFNAMDWKQSSIIRTELEHNKIDITPYVTPEDSHSKMFVAARILQNGEFTPDDFTPEQLDKLAEILPDENNFEKVGFKLLNPKFSPEEMETERQDAGFIEHLEQSAIVRTLDESSIKFQDLPQETQDRLLDFAAENNLSSPPDASFTQESELKINPEVLQKIIANESVENMPTWVSETEFKDLSQAPEKKAEEPQKPEQTILIEEPEQKSAGLMNRMFAALNAVKDRIFNTPEQEQSALEAVGKEYDTKFKEIKLDDDKSYLQSSDKSVNIHADNVEVAKLSPEAVELAVAATIAKFGNNIEVNGSDEFKDQVINTLATNDKFKDVVLDDPILQAKLTDARKEHAVNLPEANTLSAGSNKELTTYEKISPNEYDVEDFAVNTSKKHVSVFENDDILFAVAYDNKEELRQCFDDLKETLPEEVLRDLEESKENDSLDEFVEKLAEAHDGTSLSVDDYIEKQNEMERD